MATNGFRVVIDGEYGEDSGAIYLYDGDIELVMWDSAEWLAEPSLIYVIANAIRIGYEDGPDAVRTRANLPLVPID